MKANRLKANRLVLALVLAGLVAPALAEQSPQGLGLQEVIITKSMENSPSAAEGSGGPTIRSSKPKEIVVVGSKLEESTPSSLLLRTPLDAPAGLAAAPARPSAGGGSTGKIQVQDLNFTHWVDLAPPGLPSAAAAGRRTYEPITFHKRIDHATPLVAPPPLRNERSMERVSPNYTKIEKVAPALNAAAPVGPAIRR